MPHRHEFGGYRQTFMGLILFLVVAGTALPAAAQDPIHWSVARTNNDILRAGELFEVELTAQMDPTWHLYALTQPLGGPEPLVITVPPGRTFSLAGEVSSWLPKSSHDPNFNIETQFFEERAVFTLPVETALFTKDGVHRLAITVGYQTCNDRLCLPPREEELTLDVVIGNPAVGSAAMSRAPIPVVPEPRSPAPVARVPDMASASAGSSTLLGYVSLAVVMGALSLLTPCVFPMVPITVSYFTTHAGRSRRDAVVQALFYGLGIILTFTAVGFTIAVGFGASGLNRFAADPWLNLGIMALFVVFALSLFGIYEMALPSRLVTFAARADSGARPLHRNDAHGAGVYTNLIHLHGSIPRRGVSWLRPRGTGNGQWLACWLSPLFSRLPFVVLALAPQLLSALPRSGMWLIAVKATMGMLELAAGMKFLSNADLVWGWGIFTRPVVIGSWIVVAAILAAYLGGFIPLGQARRLGRPGAARLLARSPAPFLRCGSRQACPGKRLGELESFLPPADIQGVADGELAWLLNDYETALAEAKEQDRPILVDFTGYTCTNCRWMEANMFPRPDVTRELARYVRVRLYTDGRGEIYRRFQQMEQEWFGTVALPYYAVLTSAGEPMVSFGGLTRDSTEYLRFLRKGLE
jgi:thiol:disulfide interchange protein DsbD